MSIMRMLEVQNTEDIHIDGRQPKPRISIFFKNTFISVFDRKYHSTQPVTKL